MGQKYIVLGRKADNSVEMLASPSVEFGRQKLELTRNARNEKFEEVQMFALMPHTRAFHPAATLKMEADIAATEKLAEEKPTPKTPAEKGKSESKTPEEIAEAEAAAKIEELKHKLFSLPTKELIALAKEFEATNPGFSLSGISGKLEVAQALIDAGYAEEPEEFKGKTDDEILAAAKELKIELPAEAKRAEVIAAIVQASAKVEGGKQKGFFAKLFSK